MVIQPFLELSEYCIDDDDDDDEIDRLRDNSFDIRGLGKYRKLKNVELISLPDNGLRTCAEKKHNQARKA